MSAKNVTNPEPAGQPGSLRSGDLFGSLVRIKGGLKRTARVMPITVRNPNKPGEYLPGWVQVDRDLKHPCTNKWFRHWPISKLEVLPNIASQTDAEIGNHKTQ
jgi:hypothetical protein